MVSIVSWTLSRIVFSFWMGINPISTTSEPSTKDEQTKESESINQDEIMKKLIADGIDGNMDEINALEDKVMRGKIKAAIVKAKRSSWTAT